MDVITAIKSRRSIRCFQNRPLSSEILNQIMAVTRYYPSAANLQPLKFLVVADDASRERVFQCLTWAGYLSNYQLAPGNRPAAYVVILGDRTISNRFDFSAGAAATELMLVAQSLGLATCCLEPSNRQALSDYLMLNHDSLQLLYVIAIGYPAQSSQIKDVTDSTRYELDADNNLIVPKRTVSEIVCYF